MADADRQDTPTPPLLTLPIGAVERETGLSKEVLRKWEVRYGFPAPLRDGNGERAYPLDQVDRLRRVKRLLDAGLRPARILAMAPAELDEADRRPAPRAPGAGERPAELLHLLASGDLEGFRQALGRDLLRLGLERFVLDILAPLTGAVGEAWARGNLDIQDEHFYTEIVQRLLRQSLSGLSVPTGRPRVMLTTLPGEPHSLGIQMLEALLTARGAACFSLGSQTPVGAIVSAARAQRIDVLALSFSVVFPARQIGPALLELRRQLDKNIDIWAGGAGLRRAGSPILKREMTCICTDTLDQGLAQLSAWHVRHPPGALPATPRQSSDGYGH